MKHDLRIIGYITFTIFILLWINQLFSGIKLYETVKTRWQIHMDSIIESVIPPYIEILQTDSVQERTHLFSSLDSVLRTQTPDAVHFTIAQLDSTNQIIVRFQHHETRTPNIAREKSYPINNPSRNFLAIYYNFPISFFLEESWQDILAIVALTLLLVLGLQYLSHAQQHLSRLQEEMIKQVVHDWKTPLASIVTLSELVEKKSIPEDDEKGRAKIRLIQEEANRLKTSSQQLLKTLSGLAHLNITRDEFNLKNEILSLFEKQYLANHGQKNIQLNLRYLVESEIVYASHFYLLGALQNLLDNAVKYSGETPQITVICYQKRGTFVIEIRDNGPGIPKKQQKYIFNKYYQVNKDSTSKKGYGLGLTYVYNVIKAHKGKITVDSPPGKGCTFTIYLRKWKKK
ncbi:sensor histidine kinase [Butyricimonas paravirosa]